VDGDPSEIRALDLALAGVDAGPDLQAHPLEAVADRLRAPDRHGRRVESGEETVAGRVHLAAAMRAQLLSHQRVVLPQQGPPCRVTHPLGVLSGTDDVGEQQGRQDPFRLAGPAVPGLDQRPGGRLHGERVSVRVDRLRLDE
jgi:hypothetical protein